MSSAQPDRFRAVFNCFRIVFGPFSDRFGPFRTVFASFFSVFSHRGAAARPQRRHSAAAAPSQRRRSRFSTPVRRQRIRNLSFFAIFWEAPVPSLDNKAKINKKMEVLKQDSDWYAKDANCVKAAPPQTK